MSVTIRKKVLDKGRTSLYLDIYHNGKRHYEFLDLYLTKDRQQNKDIMSIAESVRAKFELEIKHNQYGLIPSFKAKSNFVSYFEKLKDSRPKSERAWGGAYLHLNNFTKGVIRFDAIDDKWLEEFKACLLKNLKAKNSAHTYFSKIVAALNQAVKDKIILNNPANLVSKIGIEEVEKSRLTIKEIKLLLKTKCNNEVVKDAFIFCCYTGLRFGDVNSLTWDNIKEGKLDFRQQKTKGFEYSPLNQTTKEILKKQSKVMDLNDKRIFKLPTIAYCIKVLKDWTKTAGIEKNIGFHTARHTFATLILEATGDLYTVSKLLGHRQISTTQIYAKIVDSKKQDAVNLLPNLKFSS